MSRMTEEDVTMGQRVVTWQTPSGRSGGCACPACSAHEEDVTMVEGSWRALDARGIT